MATSAWKKFRRSLGGESALQGAIGAMAREREEQVLRRIRDFTERVVDIVMKLHEQIDYFAADDYAKLADAAEELDRMESAADAEKAVILDRLAAGGLFHLGRADLSRLVGSMDSIANLASGTADRLALREFTLPPGLGALLHELVDTDVAAVTKLRDAVNMLEEDLRAAIPLAQEVDKIESKADEYFASIYRSMFELDTDYKTFHQLKAIIERLESIADRCNQNAELIRHMALEYLDRR